MTARRIREWPRVVAAALAVAALLVVIGVVVSSGGSSTGARSGSSSATTTLRHLNARQAASLRSDGQTLAGLRTQLAADSTQLSLVRAQLARAQAHARCWRQLALHRSTKRVSNCAVLS